MIRKSEKIQFKNILDLVEDWLEKGYQTPSLPQNSIPDKSETPIPQRSSEEKIVKPLKNPKMPPSTDRFIYKDEGGSIEEIKEKILQCQKCRLYLTRNNLVVPGIGMSKARLLVVTPPPADGASKESGPLGKKDSDYLKKWLEALELDFSRDVFITPVVKCRTPAGRPLHPEESSACLGYLNRQVRSIAPKAILILGSSAASILLQSENSFSSMLGKIHPWNGIPAMVLWEPKEVLFNPSRLRKPVWEALKKLKASWNALP